VCQDETEEIVDEHDLDNDADELDDDDVGEVLPEHFGDDLEIETKEKEINQVALWCGKLWAMLSNSSMFLEVFYFNSLVNSRNQYHKQSRCNKLSLN